MPKAHQQWTVLPHGRLVEIEPNIITVTGTIRMPLMDLPRRMTLARLTDGRLVVFSAIALTGSVLLPGYAALSCALTGRWSLWPALFGIGLGFLLTGFGVASVMSALKPYPVPGPGENPFGAPPGSSALTMLVQAVAGAAVFAANLPLIGVGIGALLGTVWMGWLCLALAVVLGAAALALGTWWGGRIYERRAPELLADLSRIR